MNQQPPAANTLLLTPNAPRASAGEMVCATLAIAAALALLTLASHSLPLIGRDFWLDEVCTWILATDPSLPHALDALRHGTDSNPPALYLILRGMHALGMPLNPVALRLFAAGSVVCGLLGCYALLRRVFGRLTSGTAIAALLAGDQLAVNLYDARFYDPWFAACAWLCFALALRHEAKEGVGRSQRAARPRWASALAMAVLAPLILLLHYFGLFTLLLIVPADFLADPRPLAARLRDRWPLLTCLPALAVVGYFYVHQRAAFTVYASWVEPPRWSNVRVFLRSTLFIWMFLSLGGTLAAAWLLRKRLPLWRPGHRPNLRPLAGLLSLALLPLIVMLFSILVQPAGIARYTLPSIAGIAVLAALGLARLRPPAVLLLAGGWIIAGGVQLHRHARDIQRTLDEQAQFAKVIASRPDERVLFEKRHDFYPLTLAAPQFRGRMFQLDFANGEDAASLLIPYPAFSYVERDAGRVVAHFYPEFALLPRSALPPGTPFLVVAADENPKRLAVRFPAATVTPLNGRIFEVTTSEK